MTEPITLHITAGQRILLNGVDVTDGVCSVVMTVPGGDPRGLVLSCNPSRCEGTIDILVDQCDAAGRAALARLVNR